VQLSKRRNIIMRIKGIRYGDSGGTGVYKVLLGGAISLKPGATTDEDGATLPAHSNWPLSKLDEIDRGDACDLK
jgi:hypothetical protein